jgi:rhamnosyltransferase subunit B
MPDARTIVRLMMNQTTIVIATLGTRGDVLPFIDLAVELQARTHKVFLLSNSNHEPLARRQGISFESVCEPELPQVDCDIRAFIAEQLIPASGRIAQRIEELAVSEPRLLVVSRFGNWGAAAACEKGDIPLVNVLLQPDAIWEEGQPIDPADLPLLNRLRSTLGLSPIAGSGTLENAKIKVSLYPDWFGYPESRSWAAGIPVGFPVRATTPEPLPQEIVRFIDDFGPPIVFALGTGMRDVETFVEVAKVFPAVTGHPVLLLSPAATDAGESVLGFRIVDYLDHAALFPHAAMVVHNGGIGVTAQAIRAGIPHLVVPFVWDQPDNAARLEALGIGRTVLPADFRRETAEAAVRELMYVDRKLLLLAKAGARATDAIPRAADEIERCL